MFRVTRVYTDKNGDSNFEDLTVALNDAGSIGALSDPVKTTSLIFREVPPSYDWDFHTAPQRQYIVLLDGEIEIETSLGEKRSFKSGDVLLVEDTTGKGHKTRNVLPVIRKSLFITLE